jgi:leader peptidase (prepilin peptidase)/N-methyltransferase
MVRSISSLEMLAILAACVVASTALFNGALAGSWLWMAIVFVTAQIIWIAWQDIVDLTIPDGAVVALAVVAAVVRLATTQNAISSELLLLLLDASLCGLAFLAVREVFFRIKGFDGMGFGDIKLAVASGMLVGIEGFAWSVFTASALGLALVVFVSVLRHESRVDRLAFGALLAPACWAFWLAQLWSTA